jgi:hypothetical protein
MIFLVTKLKQTHMAANIEKLNPLAQRARERDERINERLSCETRFSPDSKRNIDDLARAAYPEKPEEQARYAEKITASLRAHLKEGESMDSLWAYLKQNYCQTTAIIEGLLRFFAGNKGEKEIQIGQFLKPFQLEAESNLHKTKNEVRNEVFDTTRTQLASLLAELQAQNPDLPKQNTV